MLRPMRSSVACLLAIALLVHSAASSAEQHQEHYEFQAEVERLMDIIIHSLYSNREVFVRELISNSADALDKARFNALTRPSSAETQLPFEIKIKLDSSVNMLEVFDSGVGMNKTELIRNLGTVAKSGTSEFLSNMNKDDSDSESGKNLIGQFGVGFYSAFLVADKVEVSSKRLDSDEQWKWSSEAKGSFSVVQDGKNEEPIHGSGTRITLFMKDDAEEFLKHDRIEELVKKYSQFISFPIYLEVEEEIEAEQRTANDGVEDDEELHVDGQNELEDGEKQPAVVKQKVKTWKLLNDQKPIWMREPGEVSNDEYNAFYDSLEYMPGVPFARSHFKAEGEVEFRALLYIQPKKPFTFLSMNDDSSKSNVKLYVRRVLISDEFEYGLLPQYLSFVAGVVDSDDLPINVSREMLQQSKVLELIRKKLIKKALEMVSAFMAKSETEYIKFWKEFGKAIKYGVSEDESNVKRLAKLMRFRSSHSNLSDASDYTSFEQYIKRMKPEQEHIYFHGGENIEQVRDSPFLEKLSSKGYEVLYLVDPNDEPVLQRIGEFDGVKFMAASKENFKLSKEDEKSEKERIREANKAFRPLKEFIKKNMNDRVSIVKLSTRLTKSACVLSTAQYGFTAHQELAMRAQAFSNPEEFDYMMPKRKIMEINPFHSLMVKALDMLSAGSSDEEVLMLLNSVYDTALVNSGYFVYDAKPFADRMYKWIARYADVDLESQVTLDDIEERKSRMAENERGDEVEDS